jgi:hypothetical protein
MRRSNSANESRSGRINSELSTVSGRLSYIKIMLKKRQIMLQIMTDEPEL